MITEIKFTNTVTELKEDFEAQGFAILRSCFSKKEVEELKNNFEDLHARGGIKDKYEPLSVDEVGGDPLLRYPRVMHPHRFDALAKKYMLHPSVINSLRELMEEEALAAQSMYYFKPPGARGQALHQDNFYLAVDPGTCMAAWTAIDRIDSENGGLYVVPKTAELDLICPEEADQNVSFSKHLVKPPAGMKAVETKMEPGDTLFFNGSLLHGSGPNRSKERFRRSFICHYVPASAKRISHFYLPLLNALGGDVMIEPNTTGGPCGQGWEGDIH